MRVRYIAVPRAAPYIRLCSRVRNGKAIYVRAVFHLGRCNACVYGAVKDAADGRGLRFLNLNKKGKGSVIEMSGREVEQYCMVAL